ncbi:MAG: GtrA family protein [Bacteroidales bacterium]|nr:GtrA family protein [Bacteroidales bacterium]
MNEYLRFIKYALLSASAGALEFGSFALFNEVFHWHYWVSYLIALVLSVIWNFTINRKFTFKSTNNVPIAMLKVFGYYCVFTPVSTWLEQYLAGNLWWNEYWVTIINLVFNLVTEYTFQRLVVYGKNVDQR